MFTIVRKNFTPIGEYSCTFKISKKECNYSYTLSLKGSNKSKALVPEKGDLSINITEDPP
jgi:hypothetical protein